MEVRQKIVSLLHGTAKLLPHFRGKYRILHWLYGVLLIPIDRDYCVSMRNTKTKVFARLNSLIERQMLCLGEYDPSEARLIDNLIKPDWNCIDVGANIGFYTIRLSERVGSGGHVFAIEPYETVYRRLEQNTKELHNVTLVSYAVSDHPGEGLLATHNPEQPDSYNATLVQAEPIQAEQVIDIRTLSELWTLAFDVKPIHFIKIDIEGYEFKALVGAKDLIQKCKPIILMEYNKICASSMGWSFEELIEWLRTLANYSAFSIKSGGVLQPLNYEPLNEISNIVLIASQEEGMLCK